MSAREKSIVEKLGMLAWKYQRTSASQLWAKIVARTDQLFVAAEALRPDFDAGIAALLHKAGLPEKR